MPPGSAVGSHVPEVVRLGVGRAGGRLPSRSWALGRSGSSARQYDSAQQRSINQLLDSSKANEADGRLDQALIDLDTAIELARKAGPAYVARIDDWAKKRPDLARREAQTLIDRLSSSRPRFIPAWATGSTLIARAEKDPDLSPLVGADSTNNFLPP